MHSPKARLAAVITGLASLTFVGAALAEQPETPELAEEVTPVGCVEVSDPVEGIDADVDEGADATSDLPVDASDVPSEDAEDAEDAEDTEDTEDAEDTEAAEDTGCEDQADDVDVAPVLTEETGDPAPTVEAEWESHGAYVSEQARVTCWEPSDDFDNHGECVREAAQSDVGKPAKGQDADADGLSVEGADGPVGDTEDEAGDDVSSSASEAKGNAGGKGRGRP